MGYRIHAGLDFQRRERREFMLQQRPARFMKRCMLTLFLLLCLGALLLRPRAWWYDQLSVLGAVLLLGLSIFALRPLAAFLSGMERWTLWALLSGICLLVKSCWVFLVRVPLAGDYSVFWGYATQMEQWGLVYGGRYMALFPHLYGYASFLAGCLRVLGTGELTAQWVNVLLTICSGSFLFFLCRRDLRRAAAVYLLWIVCPSQSLYNTLVLSEPLYTTLLLGFLLLVSLLEEKGEQTERPVRLGLLTGITAGVLLRWCNMIRPIAPILIIALLLWRLLLTVKERKNRRLWKIFLVTVLVVYAVSGPVADRQVSAMAGEPPASVPGYSVLVGLNQSAGGSWNQEDGEALALADSRPGATAQTVQEEMWELAKNRACSGEMDHLALLTEKGKTFLGRDDACVLYCEKGLSHHIRYQILCNGFWCFTILLAAVGGALLWRREERSWLLLAPLYVLGLTLAQMLVEVAGRYHYSLLPMLLLMGVWGLFEIKRDKKERI